MSLTDFVVSPPDCGQSVTERRNYVVPMRWVVIHEYEVPEGVLAQVLPTYLDHGHHGNLPLQGKIPMTEPGIEPGTS
jgi:hypothetical protein